MSLKAPPFQLYFELLFLENYSKLGSRERKSVDKGIKLMAGNPRHPSLNVHKAKNVGAKYSVGGKNVFIAYATKNIRFTFEYGPTPGVIALRNRGPHDKCERKI